MGWGLGVEGSGGTARAGIVVTNAHAAAGQDNPPVQLGGTGDRHDAKAIAFDPTNDIAVLRVDGLGGRPLPASPPRRAPPPAAAPPVPGNRAFSIGGGTGACARGRPLRGAPIPRRGCRP